MGSQGSCCPMELKEDEIVQSIPTSEGRLKYRSIAPHTDQSQRLWVFESRIDRDSPWTPTYCFSELEFMPNDFDVMNYKTSTSRTSWFTYRFVLNNLIIDRETDVPIGAMILVGGEVKRRLHGKSEIMEVCKNEAERVKALKTWFDIDLKEDEVRGIRGMASDLG